VIELRQIFAASVILALMGCSSDDDSGEREGARSFTSLPNPAIIVASGNGSLSIIDPSSLAVVSSLNVTAGLHPHHVSVAGSGTKVLVTATSADLSAGHSEGHTAHGAGAHTTIYQLDVNSRELGSVLEIDATAHNAAFTSDDQVVVLGMLEHGTIAGYDARSFAQVFAAGDFGAPLEVTPTDSGLLLVAESGTGQVAVFDPASQMITERIDVGPLPVAAWRSGGAHYYVSVEEGQELRHLVEQGTTVSADSHALDVQGAPGQAMLLPSGAELWVAVENRGVIAVFDGADHALITELPAGIKPHGIAFDPDGTRAFVTDEAASRILVIDVASRAVTAEIPTAPKPNGIAWLVPRPRE
jgi:YVTN family beta-propeller protein